jgi:hypothetical protein
MMKTNTLTPKEQIRVLVERMPDDMTLDQLLYKLELFIAVFTGVQQLERGEGIDHDKLFDELLKNDEEAWHRNSHRAPRGPETRKRRFGR